MTLDWRTARAVLADELQQRGDPQGELIALQLALEACPSDTRRRMIERRVAAHLDAHHDALFGPLAPHVTRLSAPDLLDPVLEVTAWRAGFIDTVFVQRRIEGPGLVDALRALRTLPVARCVREIVFGIGDHPSVVAELARDPIATVRGIELDEWRRPLRGLRAVPLASLDEPLRTLLGSLEKVRLGLVEYHPFSSATLRDFAFAHPHAQAPCRFEAELPEITRLRIYNCEADEELLERYPKLEQLYLNTRGCAPTFVTRLLASPRLPQLRELMFGWSMLESDLRQLMDAADRLAHLEHLELWVGGLPLELREAARARLPPCTKLL